MSEAGDTTRPQPEMHPSMVEQLSRLVALAGGLLLLCMAMLVVVSVIGRRFFDAPVDGDFELVSMGTAIAVFAFLPFAQARRANIVVDTFTSWLPARANAYIDAFWDLVYAGMMGLLACCLTIGTLEHYRSGQTTMLLQLIVWPAIAICTALTVLLTCSALMTAVRLVRSRS